MAHTHVAVMGLCSAPTSSLERGGGAVRRCQIMQSRWLTDTGNRQDRTGLNISDLPPSSPIPKAASIHLSIHPRLPLNYAAHSTRPPTPTPTLDSHSPQISKHTHTLSSSLPIHPWHFQESNQVSQYVPPRRPHHQSPPIHHNQHSRTLDRRPTRRQKLA